AVVADELGAPQRGQVDDVLQAFRCAETRLGKRQVRGDAQDDGIGHITRLGVESTYRGGTGRRVNAGENVQELALARVGRQPYVGQILGYQAERRCLIAGLEKGAANAYRVTTQCYLRHA